MKLPSAFFVDIVYASFLNMIFGALYMIKVMWFLKRADGMSLADFRDWWLNRHAHDIARHQRPYLLRYTVNVRSEDSGLEGGTSDNFDWDGVAEQWFANAEAYNAVYGTGVSPTRADTLANTSRFARMVVTEDQYVPTPGTGHIAL